MVSLTIRTAKLSVNRLHARLSFNSSGEVKMQLDMLRFTQYPSHQLYWAFIVAISKLGRALALDGKVSVTDRGKKRRQIHYGEVTIDGQTAKK